MRRFLPIGLLLALTTGAAPTAAMLVDHVDPFIGTGGHGHTFPGPTLPFGMVQLSPDTRLTGWDGCSGYHDDDTAVYGFSHTHLSGTGVSDYGDILLAPVVRDMAPMVDAPEIAPLRFRKETERAAAGYYRVHLDDGDVDVELTATPRTGLHRYTFPAGRLASVIIDLEHRDRLLDAGLEIVDDRTVAGFRRSTAWARDQIVYFRARFSRPFTAGHLNTAEIDGVRKPVRTALHFGDAGGPLVVQVAISAVDADGAAGNLAAEWADFDFDGARARARDAWAAALERFTVEGADDADLTVFATALYHSFLAPNLFSDADGRYRGMDLAIHRAEGRRQYTVFSLWDTYRATHPLFTLVERARTREFVQTFLAQHEQGGRLPVWELAANETDCMIGYHSVSVIADAYLKGLGGFDAARALDAMVDSATRDHFGLAAYRDHGFIGSDEEGESVSKTLEYAYDDACIARMAAALGRDDVAGAFHRRAQAWRHLLDPATGFLRPRRNGQWLAPYDPRRVDFNHTEANGWQYRFAAPQHARAFAAALGGDNAFAAALDSLFTTASATTGREQADITGRLGQYAHGNEPSHHVAWLYHFAGRPERTRAWLDRILDEFYTAAPDGLIGNEDCGQMSSWYVLAALGLYDVAPTSRQWLIVPPRHERMSVTFEDGRTFITRRVGAGEVTRVLFNGEPLERSFLWHDEVVGGGELVFELGRGGDWGRAPAARPGGDEGGVRPGEAIVPAPYAVADADRFRGEMTVSLACADPEAAIRWWTVAPDGEPQDPARYTAPLRLTGTTTLRFIATRGDEASPVVTARFDAVDHDWRLDITSTPNAQYTAGGPDALIDGRRGADDWRTGAWQGYEGQDFTATLDLGAAVPLTRVGAGFLQDMRSWIWLPRGLTVEVSADGRTFRPAGRVGHDVPDDAEGVVRRDLTVALDGRPARAVRLHAENVDVCPPWHPGAGGPAFIFVDEILVETADGWP